jgi:hypothetical protein
MVGLTNFGRFRVFTPLRIALALLRSSLMAGRRGDAPRAPAHGLRPRYPCFLIR